MQPANGTSLAPATNTEEILKMINIFDVHKNQHAQRRHHEFVPESKFRIHIPFHIQKYVQIYL